MKKITFLLCLLMCLFSPAMAQKAYYLHLKGGDIQVFYTDLVDSMTVDVIDTKPDNSEYVQKIWASDSLYQFKMADIDSISYVTPPTQYKPGVIKLEDGLLDYVIGCDSLTLFLAKDTPKRRMPHVGDKVVCLEMTQILPNGFAGEVVKIEELADKIAVECKLVPLTDIFDCYYGVHANQVEVPTTTKNARAIEIPGHGVWNPGTVTYELPFFEFEGEKGSFAWNFGTSVSLSLKPYLDIRTSVIIDKKGLQVALVLSGNHILSGQLGGSGHLNFEVKPQGRFNTFQIPLGQPLIQCMVSTGPFLRAGLEADFNVNAELDFDTDVSCRWISGGEPVLPNVLRPIYVKGKKVNIEGSLGGSIQMGAYFQVGLTIVDATMNKAYFETELGEDITGTGVIMNKDLLDGSKTYLTYDKLKESGLTGHFYANCGVGATAGPFSWRKTFWSGTLGKPIFEYKLAPMFSDVQASFDSPNANHLNISSQVSGKCLPVKVGYVIHNKKEEEVAQSYVWNSYSSDRSDACRHTFLDVPTNEPLVVSPMISLLGFDIKAKPSKEVGMMCPDDHHPHFIDLGLPSGIKWACCNVGAKIPEGNGSYFAWGETSPKACYDEATYKFIIWGTDKYGDKYYDGYQPLPDFSGNPQYDAAAANWGGGARMPTAAEGRELVEQCTSVWTTRNGVNGRLVTGPNGNSIFLPAAGHRDGTSLYFAGELGEYWSSTPGEIGDYGAYFLSFFSGDFDWLWYYRYFGYSVRPVRN